MSTPENPVAGPQKHEPFVPETMEMKEFTLRAVLLGLVMTVVLGAANAYLGLRAGITIAAEIAKPQQAGEKNPTYNQIIRFTSSSGDAAK